MLASKETAMFKPVLVPVDFADMDLARPAIARAMAQAGGPAGSKTEAALAAIAARLGAKRAAE
jgi:hypothetical protein